jgi:hypothetical protein
METFAGFVVYLIVAASLSCSLSLLLVKESGANSNKKAIQTSVITTTLLFFVFSYIKFSVVGEAIMPIFDFY